MRGVINLHEKLIILMVDERASKEEESRKIEGRQGKKYAGSVLRMWSARAPRQGQEDDSSGLCFEPSVGQRASSEGSIHSQPT